MEQSMIEQHETVPTEVFNVRMIAGALSWTVLANRPAEIFYLACVENKWENPATGNAFSSAEEAWRELTWTVWAEDIQHEASLYWAKTQTPNGDGDSDMSGLELPVAPAA